MSLLLIDNFDSFTFNIVQAYQRLGERVEVIRNNAPLDKHLFQEAKMIIIGPGPGDPSQGGISKEALKYADLNVPILGICLGHQIIGEVFGAKIGRAKKAIHGKVSPIFHDASSLFIDLPQGFLATRYHSLVIEPASLPDSLRVSAWTVEGEIMGVCHKTRPIYGVQFHPDSVATEHSSLFFQNTLLT